MFAGTAANGQSTTYSCDGASSLIPSANKNFSPIITDDGTIIVRGLTANSTSANKEYTIGAAYTEKIGDEEGGPLAVTQIGDGEKAVSIGSQNKNISNAETLTIKANAEIASKALSTWTSLKTINIEADGAEPLPIGDDALPAQFASDGANCRIIVPKGMKESYLKAEGWSAYAGAISDGEPTSISMETSGTPSIRIAGHMLILEEETEIIVRNVLGRTIASGRLKSVELAKGMYIITFSETNISMKVAIKK